MLPIVETRFESSGGLKSRDDPSLFLEEGYYLSLLELSIPSLRISCKRTAKFLYYLSVSACITSSILFLTLSYISFSIFVLSLNFSSSFSSRTFPIVVIRLFWSNYAYSWIFWDTCCLLVILSSLNSSLILCSSIVPLSTSWIFESSLFWSAFYCRVVRRSK